jgi:hypothetical protein
MKQQKWLEICFVYRGARKYIVLSRVGWFMDALIWLLYMNTFLYITIFVKSRCDVQIRWDGYSWYWLVGWLREGVEEAGAWVLLRREYQ